MSKIRLTSEIAVEYIQHMGDDAKLAHAAMVSTRGVSGEGAIAVGEEKITGLINYLMKHRHGTPFEHGALTVRVHAPIKVWREWHRHRVGWSYNEESGRYKQLDPVFYIPPRDRPMFRPVGFKSANPVFEPITDDIRYGTIISQLEHGYQTTYDIYEHLLSLGIDRGLARDVLGVGIYSACYCTANPRSIMHFLELRTNRPDAKRPSKPLYEIEVAAKKLEQIFEMYWPITYKAWNDNGRAAP